MDLVTRSAPVMWTGPGGKGDGAGADDGPGFLDLAAVLLGGVVSFLENLEPVT